MTPEEQFNARLDVVEKSLVEINRRLHMRLDQCGEQLPSDYQTNAKYIGDLRIPNPKGK